MNRCSEWNSVRVPAERLRPPGNDDALRAIGLYCDLIADAVLDGIQAEMSASGADIGESAEGPLEALPDEGESAGAAGGEAAEQAQPQA